MEEYREWLLETAAKVRRLKPESDWWREEFADDFHKRCDILKRFAATRNSIVDALLTLPSTIDINQAIADLRSGRDEEAAQHLIAAASVKPPEPDAYLGAGRVRIAGQIHTLTSQNAIDLIEAILDNGGAATTKQIRKRAIINVSDTVAWLEEFAGGIVKPHIVRPKNYKGEGYRLTLIDSRETT